jgi:hypothetical protein
VRRRRGDEQELAVPALDEAGLHGLEQLAARKPKDGSVRNALDALARDGEVVKNADGLWCKVHGPLRMNCGSRKARATARRWCPLRS